MIFFIKIKDKFLGLWGESEALGKKVARGGVLIFIGRFAVKSIYFVKTIILARLLFPNDFGLFGMAALAIGITDTLFQTGFNSAIVQHKDEVDKHLNSAWTYGLLRNLFVSLLMFFVAAPLAGRFFNNETVVIFVRVLALPVFIAGFENIGIVLLQRNLQFNKKIFFDITSVIGEVVFTIGAAVIFRNAWALIVGSIANRFFMVIFSYVFHPYRPKFNLDLEGAKHLFRYGRWISLVSIITFLVGQGDNITVGKLLGAQDLGFYQLSFTLGMLPAMEFARVLGTILFPLFSKIQNDHQLLRTSFVRVMRIIFALIVPASTGLFVLAPEIVHFVYGERWSPMVPILRVIILLGFLKSFEQVVTPLFLGIGKPKINLFILIFQSIIMFSLIIPLTKVYGPVGTGWAVVISTLVSQLTMLLMVRKEINLGLKGFFEIFKLAVLASGLMYISIFYLKKMIVIDNLAVFLSFIFLGAAAYALFIFTLDRIFGRKIFNSLNWIKKSI